MQNDARTNVQPNDISVPMRLKWQRDLSSLYQALLPGSPQEFSSPVISGKALYAGSEKGRFHSIDLEKGAINWSYDAGSPIEAPAASNERLVCFGAVDGWLKCLDSASGKEAMGFMARSEIVSSPVIVDGVVFFSTVDRRLYAVSIETGEKLWVYARTTFQTISPRVLGSPAYSEGRLYHLFPDGNLVSIDASSGKEVWAKKVISDFKSHQTARRTPLVYGQSVFIINDANAIVSFNKTDGRTEKTFDFTKALDFIVLENGLIAAGPDEVSFFELPSGSRRWTIKPEGVISSLNATGNVLFVFLNYEKPFLGIESLSEARSRVLGIGIKDGKGLWRRSFDETISSYGATAGPYLAVMNDAGIVQVFESD